MLDKEELLVLRDQLVSVVGGVGKGPVNTLCRDRLISCGESVGNWLADTLCLIVQVVPLERT